MANGKCIGRAATRFTHRSPGPMQLKTKMKEIEEKLG